MSGLVYALHGFLGQSSDWSATKNLLLKHQFQAPDLFSTQSPPILDFDSYSEVLAQNIQNGKPRVFVGYSLGGRLGLYLLKNFSQLFDQFIFVSTNPGLQNNSEERKTRYKSDLQWAEKIQLENWSQFLREWNEQAVFLSSQSEPERLVTDYDVVRLRESLDGWSLSRQVDMREVLCQMSGRVTWVVGQNDKKYVSIAENLVHEKILSSFELIEGGHRLWLDNPRQLADIIERSIAKLSYR